MLTLYQASNVLLLIRLGVFPVEDIVSISLPSGARLAALSYTE